MEVARISLIQTYITTLPFIVGVIVKLSLLETDNNGFFSTIMAIIVGGIMIILSRMTFEEINK